MKNIIIFGGTGSTGTGLIDYLDENAYNITVTGKSNRPNDHFGKKNVVYIQLDISKSEDLDKLEGQSYDAAVLLAGAMPARMEGYNPQQYIDVNITGTLNVVEYCRKNNVPKIIFAQSHSDVYGHWDTGEYIPHDASRMLNLKGDHAVYIISKCTAVDLLEHYHQEYGLQTIILRLPTVYCNWPESTFFVDGKKVDMAYMYFINRARKSEPIEIWGDPSKAKDIVYVKDFAQIVEGAVNSDSAQGFYNVGTGIPTTLEEQVRGVVEVFSPKDHPSDIYYAPEKRSQVSYLYDISRTKKDLGYEPKYTYRTMLEDMKKEIEHDEKE